MIKRYIEKLEKERLSSILKESRGETEMRTETFNFHTNLYLNGKVISFWLFNHHKRAVLELDRIKRGVK